MIKFQLEYLDSDWSIIVLVRKYLDSDWSIITKSRDKTKVPPSWGKFITSKVWGCILTKGKSESSVLSGVKRTQSSAIRLTNWTQLSYCGLFFPAAPIFYFFYYFCLRARSRIARKHTVLFSLGGWSLEEGKVSCLFRIRYIEDLGFVRSRSRRPERPEKLLPNRSVSSKQALCDQLYQYVASCRKNDVDKILPCTRPTYNSMLWWRPGPPLGRLLG